MLSLEESPVLLNGFGVIAQNGNIDIRTSGSLVVNDLVSAPAFGKSIFLQSAGGNVGLRDDVHALGGNSSVAVDAFLAITDDSVQTTEIAVGPGGSILLTAGSNIGAFTYTGFSPTMYNAMIDVDLSALGTVLNAVFYALFLAALSWTDVTVVLPMTALEFGMAAILAVMILKEVVPTLRWAGIVLIIVGVILITIAGHETV